MNQKLFEAIMGHTHGEGWEAVQQVLDAEGAASLQNELNEKELKDIYWQRGYREGLRFAFNVRDFMKWVHENKDAEV
jgi:uncharacterized protein (DUF2267 family)